MLSGSGFLSGEIEDPASVGDESSSGGGASGGEDGGDGSGGGDDTTAAVSGTSSALEGTVDASGLELSTANASQNALCVIKLSFLLNIVPQSHLYSLVPQTLECAFQSD